MEKQNWDRYLYEKKCLRINHVSKDCCLIPVLDLLAFDSCQVAVYTQKTHNISLLGCEVFYPIENFYIFDHLSVSQVTTFRQL